MSKPLTVNEVLDLPASVDLDTAGRAWGFGRSKSQELTRKGEFPCQVHRYGYTYRVNRADILRALGIEDTVFASTMHPEPVDIAS